MVHGDTICIGRQMHPVRFDIHQPVTLLEKKNVGRYFCSGILLKGCIGKSHRSHKLRPLREVLSHLWRLLIHRPLACNKCYDTARSYLIKRLCKEIIVDLETQFVVCSVRHLVITKWYVTDRHIKEVILKIGLFKTADTNIRLWI